MLVCLGVCLAMVLGLGASQSAAQRLYGDGSDGDHVVTLVTKMYRDMNFQNLTVPVGCTLQTCGYTVRVNGTLTVHGAIAQYFRGPVGQSNGTGGIANGFAKSYYYDDRLANILPPYLFDISNSGWHVSRETLCVAGSTDPTSGCQAPG